MNRRSFLEKAGLGAAALWPPGRTSATKRTGSGSPEKRPDAADRKARRPGRKPGDRPNIILIMADDLGYECIGANGSESYRTPFLDGMAEKGMRFTHCYSQPLCTPSRVQLMTGKYNFRNYHMFGYLDMREVTFGHLMKQAGYATCISGKWQLSNGIEGPFHAGFDEYCLWQIHTNIAGEDARGSRYEDPKIHVNGKLMENTKGGYGPDIYCEFIESFMEKNRDKPFFVYFPMALTHDPFCPTPDSPDWETNRGAKDNRYFADMVHYMDKLAGRIHKKVRDLGLEENTLVLFTGDNGTGRGIRSKWNGKWIQGGKSFMTDAGTHVPLIASWKSTVPEGTVSDDLIDFTDFLPTFVEMAGGKLPEKFVCDGRSFLPRLTGKGGPAREWIYCYYWGNGRRVFETRQYARDKRYKLYCDGSFFDVSKDPDEEQPLAKESLGPDAAAVRKKLETVIDSMGARLP